MDDESRGFLDEDPALDCILLEEMEKGDRPPCEKEGCLTVLAVPFIPVSFAVGDFVLGLFR